MEIGVRLETVISLQDGEVNINEILHALGMWGREMTIKVAQGAVDAYQKRIVELLCAGEGRETTGCLTRLRATAKDKCAWSIFPAGATGSTRCSAS